MRIAKNLLNKDSTILVLLLILGLAGLWLFKEKEKTVFPTSSIDLSIDKKEILSIAENWAKRLDYVKQPIVRSIVFDDDDDSNTFLGYELGNAQADELTRKQIPIFYWDCKFRKPFDQETMETQISPAGTLVAFAYTMANDKKIPSINHTEAQKKAFTFVNEITGWNETDCKLVTDVTTAQINRTDYKFTWEYQKLEWHGAKLRSDVEIAGNTLKGFDHYLKRPETWDRNYATVRTKNLLLEAIASVFFFSLYPMAAFIFLQGLTRKNIRWRFVIGATSILTLIFMAESYNNFPVLLANYSPDTSYKVFILQSIIYPILYAPFLAISVAIMSGAGEIVYRRLFPEKLALENIFTKAGLGSRELRIGLMIGLCWFGAMLGYQILYYWFGKNFHFWCPIEVDNYQALSTYCPWVGAINLGAFASSNEEILYRVLMLGLTKFVVRRFWLANILQAAAWGFMHSTYPQQPCYARGLELTIEGMLEGWLISRFGFLACLVAHYCFDAFACVTPLFSAPTYLKLSSALPFLPIFVAIICSFVIGKKSQVSEESLSNKTIICPETSATHSEISSLDPITKYQPLLKFTRWALIVFSLLGLTLFFASKKNFAAIGVNAKPLHVTRQQAVDKARAYLISKHFDLNGYMVGTQLDDNIPGHEEIQYIFEQIGYAKTKKIVRDVANSFTWNVKFVKPLMSTEYSCDIDETGRLSGFTVERGEDESGASISEKDARVIAENFLKQDPELNPFELDDVSVDKKKHRIDYTFTFKVPKYKVKDAEFKVGINVIGDVASDSFWNWDLPDKWKWERTKRTSREEIFSIVSIATSIIAALAFIYWIVFLFRSNKVRWRYALMLGSVILFCNTISSLNSLNTFFNYYRNTVPLNIFYVISAIGGLLGMLFLFGASVFGIAIVLAGSAETIKLRVKTVLYETFINFSKHLSLKVYREMILDSIVLSCAILTASWLCVLLNRVLNLYFAHEIVAAKPSDYIGGITNSFFGPLAIGTNLLFQLISEPLLLGLVIALGRYLRLNTYWRILGSGLLVYVLTSLSTRYWQDFFVGLISGLISLTILWFIVTKAFNRNILSLFMSVWLGYTCTLTAELWKYGWPTFSTEVTVATVLLALPFFSLLYVYVMPSIQNIKLDTRTESS